MSHGEKTPKKVCLSFLEKQDIKFIALEQWNADKDVLPAQSRGHHKVSVLCSREADKPQAEAQATRPSPGLSPDPG